MPVVFDGMIDWTRFNIMMIVAVIMFMQMHGVGQNMVKFMHKKDRGGAQNPAQVKGANNYGNRYSGIIKCFFHCKTIRSPAGESAHWPDLCGFSLLVLLLNYSDFASSPIKIHLIQAYLRRD